MHKAFEVLACHRRNKSRWVGGHPMLVREEVQLYRFGGQLRYRFQVGEELVYVSCTRVDGQLTRLFAGDDGTLYECPAPLADSAFEEPAWYKKWSRQILAQAAARSGENVSTAVLLTA